jgi:hypothetical protein
MGIVYLLAGFVMALAGIWGIGYSIFSYLKSYHRTPIEAVWWSMIGSFFLACTLCGIGLAYAGGQS